MATTQRMASGVVAFALGGCSPTYAPPLQGPHGGAPGRVDEGTLAIQAAAAGLSVPAAGGPALSYGIRDWVAVEAGGNLSLGEWGMGWLGPRFTYAPRRFAKNYLALDLQLAGGAGWGGERCGNPERPEAGLPRNACGEIDGRDNRERFAGGGALGFGVAGHFSFFSVYARARSQLTAATGVPATYWGTGGAGVQFRIARRVDLYTQVGGGGYANRRDDLRFMLYELGVAVRFSTLGWGRGR